MNWGELFHQPLYGVSLTMIVYVISLMLQKRWKGLHPLLTTSVLLIIIVVSSGTLEAYRVGGEYITFMLGPATVALGVPLYKQFARIKDQIIPIIAGVTSGVMTGVASAGFTVYILGGSKEIWLSMMPKSATTPISVELVQLMGGFPELAAMFTVLTGLFGSLIGPRLLKLFGIRSDLALGTAVGTAAHGIGTARLIRESEVQGSISALAMGISGIITSLVIIPVYLWV